MFPCVWLIRTVHHTLVCLVYFWHKPWTVIKDIIWHSCNYVNTFTLALGSCEYVKFCMIYVVWTIRNVLARDVLEDSNHQACYAMLNVKLLIMFERITVHSSSGLSSPRKLFFDITQTCIWEISDSNVNLVSGLPLWIISDFPHFLQVNAEIVLSNR